MTVCMHAHPAAPVSARTLPCSSLTPPRPTHQTHLHPGERTPASTIQGLIVGTRSLGRGQNQAPLDESTWTPRLTHLPDPEALNEAPLPRAVPPALAGAQGSTWGLGEGGRAEAGLAWPARVQGAASSELRVRVAAELRAGPVQRGGAAPSPPGAGWGRHRWPRAVAKPRGARAETRAATRRRLRVPVSRGPPGSGRREAAGRGRPGPIPRRLGWGPGSPSPPASPRGHGDALRGECTPLPRPPRPPRAHSLHVPAEVRAGRRCWADAGGGDGGALQLRPRGRRHRLGHRPALCCLLSGRRRRGGWAGRARLRRRHRAPRSRPRPAPPPRVRLLPAAAAGARQRARPAARARRARPGGGGARGPARRGS